MENNDKLENYIKKNRDSFNSRTPRDIWFGIESNLGFGKKNNHSWIWKAATIIFFMSTVYLIINQNIVIPSNEKSEFANVEDFYLDEISAKITLIKKISESSSGISASSEQDLQKLDAMYLVLKEELKSNPSHKVVDALTLNLLIRIDILNEELRSLEVIENESEIDAESNDSKENAASI